jgi:hypothetical protein
VLTILKFLFLFAILSVVLLFQLPLYVDLFIFLFLFLLGFFVALVDAVILSVSSIAFLILAGGILLWRFPPEKIYYREHEKFQQNGAYIPNISETIKVPHGDLLAIDSSLPTEVKDPRTVKFFTDNAGFRNKSNFSNQTIILNGDSFVVGNGTSQEDVLSQILNNDFKISNYSIAFPSDPSDYDRRASEFQQAHKDKQIRFAHFFYEGNDFEIVDSNGKKLISSSFELPAEYGKILDDYQKAKASLWQVSTTLTRLGRIGSALSARVERDFFLRKASEVDLFRVQERLIAFHRPQGHTAEAKLLKLKITGEMHPEVWQATPCIFFIPTKDRVYAPFLDGKRNVTNPPPGLVALKKWVFEYNPSAKVIDLTPDLYERARELIRLSKIRSLQNEHVYWKDDTHWNGEGIRSVAKTVAGCVAG